jgi:hypothetical protein
MRGLSSAFGRDPGYVAALLDPSRPSRARPTPADLVLASDATGIPFVELLERLWGIEPARLGDELDGLGMGSTLESRLRSLTPRDRTTIADLIDFLAVRRSSGHERPITPELPGAISAGRS